MHRGDAAPREFMHEHHIHTQAAGGSDATENLVFLCPTCHNAVHIIARKAAAGKPSEHLYDFQLWNRAAAKERARKLVREVLRYEVIETSNVARKREVKVTLRVPISLYKHILVMAGSSKKANGRKGTVPAVILNILRKHFS